MELVDIYDEKTGLKTNESIDKDVAHEKGIWHSAIHVIIFNKEKNKVLLQKRCKLKKLFPNMWDISVGGHISSGEIPLLAAIRELKEELGIEINSDNLIETNIIKEEFLDNGLDSREFVYVYVLYDNINVDDIVLQVDEVLEVKWFSKLEFMKLIENKKFINHDKEIELIRDILQ